MKSLKSLIKKNSLVIGVCCVIFLCVIGMCLTSGSNKKVQNEGTTEIQQEVIKTDTAEAINVFYEEKDDNKTYNYIINPSVLNGSGIYVRHIQEIPDEINRVLNEQGYKGEQLKIENAKQSGTKIKFDVVVVSDNERKACEYSLRYGTFSIE